jgi:tetratricopeptide (TPR) repeat protein
VTLFARLRKFAWGSGPATPFEAGVAAHARRRPEEALAHFAQAYEEAQTAADRAAAANKLGIVYVQLSARADALAAFLLAIEHDATHVPAIVNIGNLLLEDGDTEEAIVHYESALRLDDDYAVGHLNLGVALKKLGRRGEAVREFRRATRLEGRLKPKR